MAVETLVAYINEGKKRGFTLEQLHKSLLDQGYNIEDIQKAVSITENAPILNENHGIKMEPETKTKTHNLLVFIIGIVLILILVGFLIFLKLPREVHQVNDKTIDVSTFIPAPLPELPEDRNTNIKNTPLEQFTPAQLPPTSPPSLSNERNEEMIDQELSNIEPFAPAPLPE